MSLPFSSFVIPAREDTPDKENDTGIMSSQSNHIPLSHVKQTRAWQRPLCLNKAIIAASGTMSENFKAPEPEWVLDKNGNGHLVWRRDIDEEDTNSRVKFKHDVEVKEFHRKSYELLEPPWVRESEPNHVMSMGVTCLVCVTVTLILPWYLLGGRNVLLALVYN